MFSLTHSTSNYGFNSSQFRFLAACSNSCPANQCLVDCVCKPQDECEKKDFTVILIVVSVAAIVIILFCIGCYLCRKEKARTRLTTFDVHNRAQISGRDVDNSRAHLQLDPLDMPVGQSAANIPVNNVPRNIPAHYFPAQLPTNIPTNAPPTGPVQMVITVNMPHIMKPEIGNHNISPVNGKVHTEVVAEDNSISFINNKQQTDIAIEDHSSSFVNNKLQTEITQEGRENQSPADKSVLKDMMHKEEHNNSNLIIHKTPTNHFDNFEILESKKEKEPDQLNKTSKLDMSEDKINHLDNKEKESDQLNKTSKLDMSESKDEKEANPWSKLGELDISDINEEQEEVDPTNERDHL